MKRHANANWNGSGKEGEGTLSMQSGILEQAQYSYKSRFEEGKGTNPEELIAAAHAGCFSMKLSFALDEAGHKDKKIDSTCHISLEEGKITESKIKVTVTGKDISQETFDQCVKDAELNCPVSQLLDTKITVESTLNN